MQLYRFNWNFYVFIKGKVIKNSNNNNNNWWYAAKEWEETTKQKPNIKILLCRKQSWAITDRTHWKHNNEVREMSERSVYQSFGGMCSQSFSQQSWRTLCVFVGYKPAGAWLAVVSTFMFITPTTQRPLWC